MSFLVALTQKLNQCHHKDRKAVLHHFGLPSHSPGPIVATSSTLVSLAERNNSLSKVLLTTLVLQCPFKLTHKPMLRLCVHKTNCFS